MKKLLQLAVLAMSLLFTSYSYAKSFTCDELAINYGKESIKFAGYIDEIVPRVASGDHVAIGSNLNVSITRLSYYLNKHKAQHCDDVNFIEKLGYAPDFVAYYINDNKLNYTNYCNNIDDFSIYFEDKIKILKAMEDAESLKDKKEYLYILYDYVKRTNNNGLSYYLALYTGSLNTTPQMIENLTLIDIENGYNKALEAQYLYEDIVNFQKLHKVVFCPAEPEIESE